MPFSFLPTVQHFFHNLFDNIDANRCDRTGSTQGAHREHETLRERERGARDIARGQAGNEEQCTLHQILALAGLEPVQDEYHW